jgi:hypothetical protein
VLLIHRSSANAVKRSSTHAAACLNRTRRWESVDTLVLVVKRRLSEFGTDASFPLGDGPQGSKSGADSTARQAQHARGRRGLHRVGRQGCAAPPRSDSNRCTENVASALPRVEGWYRTEGGPGSRVSSL